MSETLDHPVLTDAQAAVLGALLSMPDGTAKELAEMAGTGGSTTTKALVLLEQMGLARRVSHQQQDGKRGAATWRPTAIPEPEAAPVDDAGNEFEAQDLTSEHGAVRHVPVENSVPETKLVGDGQPEPEDNPVEEKAEPVVATGGVAKNERLASGGLRALVVELLASRPDVEFTPTSLSHLLGGRSSGAIANCLSALTEQGLVERTSDKPRRYRHPAIATDTA